jgi:HAD superfamily hydrolase (TIGR01549 family)
VWTFYDVLAARESKAAAGSRWPVYDVVSEVLSEQDCAALWERTDREVRDRFDELSQWIPEAMETVDRLGREFHLGLIANQEIECRRFFARFGTLDHFEVVAFSEEQGRAKPDPELFRIALDQAGASPEECVMVGDRLDNDIEPASNLGMATVWLHWPRREAKGWRPEDPRAKAYLDSLDRLGARGSDTIRPTSTIHHIRELDRVLKAGIEVPPRKT